MALFASSCTIDAPVECVWDALCDWEATRHWMRPPTTVEVLGAPRTGEGTRIRAVTTIAGVLKLVDHMVVTSWVEQREIRTRHVGWMLKGDGIFRLHPEGARTRFEWIELLPMPLGPIGEVAARIGRPIVEWFIRRSCARLGAYVIAA